MQISPVFQRKLNCVCQIIIHPSHKSFSFLSPPVFTVIPAQRWHLWIKTIPCAFLTVARHVKTVTSNKHRTQRVASTIEWKHRNQRAHLQKKSSLSKVGSCQYYRVKRQLVARFELQGFFLLLIFFFSLIFLRESFSGTPVLVTLRWTQDSNVAGGWMLKHHLHTEEHHLNCPSC